MNVDENYIKPCQVVMQSIVEKTRHKVRFHIIGEDFDTDKDVVFYEKPDLSMLKNTNQNAYITMSACYRLFAPYLDLDKVIYIDCDTVVLDDIQELWCQNVEYIGGVLDPMYIHQARKNNLKHKYINSGVMVMNLKNLRKLPYLTMIKATQNGNYNLSLLDQDIINIAFGRYISLLPYEWNVYAKIYSNTTDEMQKARNNPKLIHWCGKDKPWNADVWKKDEWFRYVL